MDRAWLTLATFGEIPEKIFFAFYVRLSGDSANAVPHYHKLCTRLTHIWSNRRGQPNQSAMEGPRPGGLALLITNSPVQGKYEFIQLVIHLLEKVLVLFRCFLNILKATYFFLTAREFSIGPMREVKLEHCNIFYHNY